LPGVDPSPDGLCDHGGVVAHQGFVTSDIVQHACLISQRAGTFNNMLDDPALDRTYAALADPTRRALLVALRDGESRITDLAAPLPMTFAGVSRHVAVLEAAGLVQRTVRGREHWLSVRPDSLDPARRWIADQTAFWNSRADALAARLERKRSGAA
jgi:DNA-binding transcriptional ArsR family regulator